MAAVMLLTVTNVLLSACGPSEVLKLYNWGEYMDEDVVKDFADWYKDETGKSIRVEETPFDSNENMYTQIVLNKKDFDLACPSDYMAEKMMNEGHLKPLDKTIFSNYSAYDNKLLAQFVDIFDNAAPAGKTARDYFAPYMWGTMGIMYDTTAAIAGDIESWSVLWEPGNNQKIYMKDSSRDVFTMGTIYANTDVLAEKSGDWTNYGTAYKNKLEEVFKDTSTANMDAVKKELGALHKLVKAYGSDNLKSEMIEGGAGKLGLFWSCDAGMAMMENDDLSYVIPYEGSNVYADYFVIPQYAQNVQAANYFLKYLNEVDNAKLNMEYCGAPSFVKEANDAIYDELFSKYGEEVANVLFADRWKDDYCSVDGNVLERCVIMRDLGAANTAKIDVMYADLRKGTL